jgi:hypothetical protein
MYELLKFLNYRRRINAAAQAWKADKDKSGSMHRRERLLRKLIKHVKENRDAMHL